MDTTTLIRNGLTLVGDPRNGQLESLDILIVNGVIAAYNPAEVPEHTEVIDANGCLVVPGFVDTHHHLWETTLRGMTADWTLIDFVWGVRFHHASIHTAEDIYAGTFAGATAALDAGITTTLDFNHAVNSPQHARSAVEALEASGIRALWCYGMNASPSDLETPFDRSVDIRQLKDEMFSDANSVVSLGLALNDIGTVPWATTRSEVQLARELDIHLTTHTDSFWSPGRAPEIEWLHHDGLLDNRQTHAHVNTASRHELQLLADSGAGVASTPETELQMGMSFPIFGQADELGVNAGLGTDIQANNSADPFTQMRVSMHSENARHGLSALQGPYGIAGYSVRVTTRDILHHATLGGAKALGRDSTSGSIEVGKNADLLLVRTDGLHHRPLIDPISSLVMNGRVSDVDTVMVGGKVVKRAGRLTDDRAEKAGALVDDAWSRLAPQVEARGGSLPDKPDGLLQQMAEAGAQNAPEWTHDG